MPSVPEKADFVVIVALTPSEIREVKLAARKSNLPVNEFFRQRVGLRSSRLGNKIPERICVTLTEDLVQEIQDLAISQNVAAEEVISAAIAAYQDRLEVQKWRGKLVAIIPRRLWFPRRVKLD